MRLSSYKTPTRTVVWGTKIEDSNYTQVAFEKFLFESKRDPTLRRIPRHIVDIQNKTENVAGATYDKVTHEEFQELAKDSLENIGESSLKKQLEKYLNMGEPLYSKGKPLGEEINIKEMDGAFRVDDLLSKDKRRQLVQDPLTYHSVKLNGEEHEVDDELREKLIYDSNREERTNMNIPEKYFDDIADEITEIKKDKAIYTLTINFDSENAVKRFWEDLGIKPTLYKKTYLEKDKSPPIKNIEEFVDLGGYEWFGKIVEAQEKWISGGKVPKKNIKLFDELLLKNGLLYNVLKKSDYVISPFFVFKGKLKIWLDISSDKATIVKPLLKVDMSELKYDSRVDLRLSYGKGVGSAEAGKGGKLRESKFSEVPKKEDEKGKEISPRLPLPVLDSLTKKIISRLHKLSDAVSNIPDYSS